MLVATVVCGLPSMAFGDAYVIDVVGQPEIAFGPGLPKIPLRTGQRISNRIQDLQAAVDMGETDSVTILCDDLLTRKEISGGHVQPLKSYCQASGLKKRRPMRNGDEIGTPKLISPRTSRTITLKELIWIAGYKDKFTVIMTDSANRKVINDDAVAFKEVRAWSECKRKMPCFVRVKGSKKHKSATVWYYRYPLSKQQSAKLAPGARYTIDVVAESHKDRLDKRKPFRVARKADAQAAEKAVQALLKPNDAPKFNGFFRALALAQQKYYPDALYALDQDAEPSPVHALLRAEILNRMSAHAASAGWAIHQGLKAALAAQDAYAVREACLLFDLNQDFFAENSPWPHKISKLIASSKMKPLKRWCENL